MTRIKYGILQMSVQDHEHAPSILKALRKIDEAYEYYKERVDDYNAPGSGLKVSNIYFLREWYEASCKCILHETMNKIDDMNIIFPIHPRTKNTMDNFGLFDRLNDLKHIHIIKPVGYLDFLLLISKSTIILTDSGGLQEEAITLDVPALTLRYNTERPETVTAGGNILVGSDKEVILENARRILDDEEFANKMKSAKNPYGMGNAAELMIKIIEDADKNDNLKMESPDEVMSSFTRKMKVIDEDISVDEFENNNNSLIKIAFDGEEIKFPYDDLNLNGLTIIYEDYAN